MYQLFFGTYAEDSSQGIYSANFDERTGRIENVKLAAEVADPSFIACATDQRTLYAVSEFSSSVHAYSISPNRRLSLVSTRDTGGKWPCHLAVHPSGKVLLVTNYFSGSIAAFHIETDGRLDHRFGFHVHSGNSVHPERQTSPHAHGATFSPDGKNVFIADLGLDQIVSYRLKSEGPELEPLDEESFNLESGSGPRHLVFSRDGRHAYIVNELANSVTVADFEVETSRLRHRETVKTLPSDDQKETTAAEIAVHPSDRYVYVSNRGHDSITVFFRDPESGALTATETVYAHGRFPRHFAISPDGRWLLAANRRSSNVAVFEIDPGTGRIRFSSADVRVPGVACVLFPNER